MMHICSCSSFLLRLKLKSFLLVNVNLDKSSVDARASRRHRTGLWEALSIGRESGGEENSEKPSVQELSKPITEPCELADSCKC